MNNGLSTQKFLGKKKRRSKNNRKKVLDKRADRQPDTKIIKQTDNPTRG